MDTRTTQSSFLTHPTFQNENRREHGGTLGQGLRKNFRPLDPRRPLHVVLRSQRAQGHWSLLRPQHEKRVKHLVYWCARRHGVRVFRFANSGNHLHLVIHGKKREAYQNYLRTLSGLLARAITGAKKGVKKGRFWDALAYSRVVTWGREFRSLNFYVIMNELEGLGVWSRHFSNVDKPAAPPPGTGRDAPKADPTARSTLFNRFRAENS